MAVSITHYQLDTGDYQNMMALGKLQNDYSTLCNDIVRVIRGMLEEGLPDRQKVAAKILGDPHFNKVMTYTPKSGKHKDTEQSCRVIPRRYLDLAINRVLADIAKDVYVQYGRQSGVDLDVDVCTPEISKLNEVLNIKLTIKPFGTGRGERVGIPCVPTVAADNRGMHAGQSRLIPIGTDYEPEFLVVSVVDVPEKTEK